jgi:hypothetical protein
MRSDSRSKAGGRSRPSWSRSARAATRTATEQHAAEVAKLNELLQAGAIDQATYARAVEDANDRALRSSQAWTDGATRFLKD